MHVFDSGTGSSNNVWCPQILYERDLGNGGDTIFFCIEPCFCFSHLKRSINGMLLRISISIFLQ